MKREGEREKKSGTRSWGERKQLVLRARTCLGNGKRQRGVANGPRERTLIVDSQLQVGSLPAGGQVPGRGRQTEADGEHREEEHHDLSELGEGGVHRTGWVIGGSGLKPWSAPLIPFSFE